MIISASRRTDIPAFYSKWFLNRIEAGYCNVPNPFNPSKVSCVSLKPEDVDVIVFWTKNVFPMLERLYKLNERGFNYFFHYTINGYPTDIEPFTPSLEDSINAFIRLADQIGPVKVIWRYDPILISNITPFDYHVERFQRIAESLASHTHRVMISIADTYRAAQRRLKEAHVEYLSYNVEDQGFINLLDKIADIANNAGLDIYSCAEAVDLSSHGIKPGKCIDDVYICKVFGIDVTSTKDRNQRQECGCIPSKDIGQYDTCLHGCKYCYAVKGWEQSMANSIKHSPDSSSIIG